MLDRKRINDYKNVVYNKTLKEEELIKMLKYAPEGNDKDELKQVLKELKMYTFENIKDELNRSQLNAPNTDSLSLTRDKIIGDSSIRNTLIKIEKNDPHIMDIVRRHTLKSELDSIPKKTAFIPNGKKKPKKTYSYYYVIAIEAIFKERNTMTVEDKIKNDLAKDILNRRAIEKLCIKTLGKECYLNINEYKRKALKEAIWRKQNKLEKNILNTLSEYRKHVTLAKYLNNLENVDEYINVLKVIIKMSDNNEITKSDVVRLADLLTHKSPLEVLSHARLLANNKAKLDTRK